MVGLSSEERSLLEVLESLATTRVNAMMLLLLAGAGLKRVQRARKTRRRSRDGGGFNQGEENLPFFLRAAPQDENGKKGGVSGIYGGVSASSFPL